MRWHTRAKVWNGKKCDSRLQFAATQFFLFISLTMSNATKEYRILQAFFQQNMEMGIKSGWFQRYCNKPSKIRIIMTSCKPMVQFANKTMNIPNPILMLVVLVVFFFIFNNIPKIYTYIYFIAWAHIDIPKNFIKLNSLFVGNYFVIL